MPRSWGRVQQGQLTAHSPAQGSERGTAEWELQGAAAGTEMGFPLLPWSPGKGADSYSGACGFVFLRGEFPIVFTFIWLLTVKIEFK